MNTCKITLFSGRKVPCTREAAELAIAFDAIQRYPKAAASLVPPGYVKSLQESLAMLQRHEKQVGLARVNEALHHQFNPAPAK